MLSNQNCNLTKFKVQFNIKKKYEGASINDVLIKKKIMLTVEILVNHINHLHKEYFKKQGKKSSEEKL